MTSGARATRSASRHPPLTAPVVSEPAITMRAPAPRYTEPSTPITVQRTAASPRSEAADSAPRTISSSRMREGYDGAGCFAALMGRLRLRRCLMGRRALRAALQGGPLRGPYGYCPAAMVKVTILEPCATGAVADALTV